MDKEKKKFIEGKKVGRIITLSVLKKIIETVEIITGGMFARGELEHFIPECLEKELCERAKKLIEEGKIKSIINGDIELLIEFISYVFRSGFVIATMKKEKDSLNKIWATSKFSEN